MRTTPRRLTATAVLLATAVAGTVSTIPSATAAPDREDRVTRAADRYGVGERALRQRLGSDPSLRLTPSGTAYFVDPAPAKSPEQTGLVAEAFPLADTFQLHSNPGSQRTIFLDFDGHNVSNTLWNTNFDGAGPSIAVPSGDYPAWDPAGNGPDFTDSEKAKVQGIFQRVAEDYAPFDVDVTTEEPAPAALDRSNSGDQVYGTRALITPSDTAMNNICGAGGCGGVAFLGVFNHYSGKDFDPRTHAEYQPAWIFPQALSNDVKNIAEATTHEVGHNLGLDHDGLTNQGYYAGHDMWAPIMGVGYDKPIVQFALNDYHANADLGGGHPSFQSDPDDLVTITEFGAGFRTDEPGTAIGNAGAVPAGSAYIHNRTDVDYFALGTCSGTVTVQVNNAPVSPNLDIEAQLLNAGNTVLDTDNLPSAYSTFDVATGMDATVSASALPSGEYYVRVDGIGRGSATTSYTDYGSVGAYTLNVTGCAGGPVTQAPSAPQNLTGSYLGSNQVQLNWAAPADDGGAAITSYNVYVDGNNIGSVSGLGALVTGVPSGVHDFGVAAVNSAGEGPQAHVSVNATDAQPQAKPGKPRIGDATPGKRGGKLTAKVRWWPPSAVAHPPINGYRVITYKRNRNGKFVKVSASPVLGPGKRAWTFSAGHKGKYKFAVKARNSLGFGPLSAKSNAVTPR